MSVNPTALQAQMMARDLDVPELAKRADVSEGAIYRMLKPGNHPLLKTERKVAAALASIPAKPGVAEAFQAIAS